MADWTKCPKTANSSKTGSARGPRRPDAKKGPAPRRQAWQQAASELEESVSTTTAVEENYTRSTWPS
jgi:hypothetical protein